jgi:predicted acetyltransferase
MADVQLILRPVRISDEESEHRRKGYASEILRQSLVIARSFDVARVLVTCDEDNAASARTIVRNGGILENVVENPAGGARKQRYWIE